ncbi:hypothetical protein AVEN_54323-1 [Araneus ventricosus]|uniref:Uncharacterized protein n=1 Tax=Araneus ventricosus TaxID=182803 RepID=A0A4Y2HBF8_ARAVE|nr:hypothetical protein AVEN_54323-1 [Araneus ventricosus]
MKDGPMVYILVSFNNDWTKTRRNDGDIFLLANSTLSREKWRFDVIRSHSIDVSSSGLSNHLLQRCCFLFLQGRTKNTVFITVESPITISLVPVENFVWKFRYNAR